jgi:hypothetical protein
MRRPTRAQQPLVPFVAPLALLLTACHGGPNAPELTARDQGALDAEQNVAGLEDGATVLQQVSLASIGSAAVQLANGDWMQVDQAAAAALSRHRDLVTQLAGAPGALLGAATTTEELIETEHSVRIVATTRFTVVDPVALRLSSPHYRAFRFKNANAVPLASLTPAERAWFDDFKAKVLLKPASHPLGQAARQGSQALWAAMLAGKGDVNVISYAEYPTGGLQRNGNVFQVPQVVDGYFDFSRVVPKALKGVGVLDQLDDGSDHDSEPIGINHVDESGKVTTVSAFVNGYGDHQAYNKGETWDLGLAKVHVGLHGDYGWGFRIPIRVTGTIDPADIRHVGNERDEASEFHTAVDVDVINAGPEFYEAAGLPADEIEDGQEFVFNADAEVKLKVWVFGGVALDKELPNSDGIDLGQNYAPPFGDCGTDCGLQFWIDPRLTKTDLNFGIAGANAQLGFKVSGTGEVTLDYQSMYDGEVVKSASGAGEGQKTHSLSFTGPDERNFHTDLARLRKPGSKSFGYKLSNIDYRWDFTLTPGVKAEVWAGVKGLDWSDTLGPFWLGAAAVKLGSMTFPTYAGSHASRTVTPGRKIWDEIEVDTQDVGGASSSVGVPPTP